MAQTEQARRQRQARLMKIANVPMRALLALPFPTPAGGRLMLAHLTGRKSGRHYRQPLSYIRDGDVLLTPGGGRWTANLADGRPVLLRIKGHDVTATPELVRDPAEVENLLDAMAAKNPALAKFVPAAPHGRRTARTRGAAPGNQARLRDRALAPGDARPRAMSPRPFRFGVVATPQAGPARWLDTARRTADLGYSTLLMPDGLQLLAPGPSLAAAATAAPTLRVGTWVYAAPLRPARATAWEAHSLTVITGGRFEMGIGTGRPGTERYASQLGLPFGSAGERLAQVGQTIAALRELDGPDHRTPVLVAAGGPKARAFAARHADIVTLAADPGTDADAVATMADDLRAQAGDRADDLEIACSVFVVGDAVPGYLAGQFDLDELRAKGSLAVLPADPDEAVELLVQRRDRLGISYVTVSAEFADALAPVVERLSGKT